MSGAIPAASKSERKRDGGFLIKSLLILSALSVAGVAILLVLLWREHRSRLELPVPSGRFPVGRTTFSWRNDSRIDELAPSPDMKRQAFVWMWYPAASHQVGPTAEYLPRYWRDAIARSASRFIGAVLMNDYFTRDYRMVQTHSFPDAPVASDQAAYPVVIMRPGLGALTIEFTTLAEDLASHGYIVVGFDAPYRTGVFVTPDGQVIRRPPEANPEILPEAQAETLAEKLMVMWTQDVQFVVDQLGELNSVAGAGRFAGRLDLAHLGAVGHSLGGATAFQFCRDDARCKAAIDIDGQLFGSSMRDGIAKPGMFLLSSRGEFKVAPAEQVIFDRIQSVYKRLPTPRWLLAVRGTNHFSFGDQIILKSSYFVRLLQPLDARRGLAITTSYVHTFFDVTLKSAPLSNVDALQRVYSEVQSVQ